jgi:putative redox protein
MTAEVIYLGQLRTQATHLASSSSFITDAPIDNHGRGEAFSPTDAVCASLASCMLTIMGIFADGRNWDIKDTRVSVTKIMNAQPRKISRIELIITVPDFGGNEEDKRHLEKAAKTCPVALSLHPDIEQHIVFNWL